MAKGYTPDNPEDKIYTIWNTLKVGNGGKIADDFPSFYKKYSNPEYRGKVLNSLGYLGINQFKSLDDMDEFVGGKYQPEPWYKSIGDFFKAVQGDTEALREIGGSVQNAAEQVKTALETGYEYFVHKIADETVLPTGDPLYSPTYQPITEEQVKLRKEEEDKFLKSSIEEYSKKRKELNEKYYETGALDPSPGVVDEFMQGMGFTATVLAASAINPTLGFMIGAQAQGIDLAADIYDATGSLEDAKTAYGIGLVLGATEAFGPGEFLRVIRNPIKKQLIKRLGKEIPEELIGVESRLSASYFFKETGRQFGIEGSQEGFQDIGEQLTKIHFGVQESFDLGQTLKATILGGITGSLFGLASVGYSQSKIGESIEFVRDVVPKEIDRLVKAGTLTETEAEEYKAKLIDALKDEKTFYENQSKVVNEVRGKQLEAAKESSEKLAVYSEFQRLVSAEETDESKKKALDIEEALGGKLNPIEQFVLRKSVALGKGSQVFQAGAVALSEYTNRILDFLQLDGRFQGFEINRIKGDIKGRSEAEKGSLIQMIDEQVKIAVQKEAALKEEAVDDTAKRLHEARANEIIKKAEKVKSSILESMPAPEGKVFSEDDILSITHLNLLGLDDVIEQRYGFRPSKGFMGTEDYAHLLTQHAPLLKEYEEEAFSVDQPEYEVLGHRNIVRLKGTETLPEIENKMKSLSRRKVGNSVDRGISMSKLVKRANQLAGYSKWRWEPVQSPDGFQSKLINIHEEARDRQAENPELFGMISLTEQPVKFRLLEALRSKDAEKIYKINKGVFENFIKAFEKKFPRYQINALMSELFRRDNPNPTLQEIIDAAETIFPDAVRLVVDKGADVLDSYLTHISPDINTHFNLGFVPIQTQLVDYIQHAVNVLNIAREVRPVESISQERTDFMTRAAHILNRMGIKVVTFEDLSAISPELTIDDFSTFNGYDPSLRVFYSSGRTPFGILKDVIRSLLNLNVEEFTLSDALARYLIDPSKPNLELLTVQVEDMIQRAAETRYLALKTRAEKLFNRELRQSEVQILTDQAGMININKKAKKQVKLLVASLTAMTSKEANEPISFPKVMDALREDKPFYDFIVGTLQIEGSMLTGSASLSNFGTVYRSSLNLHDIDIIADYKAFEKMHKDLIQNNRLALLRTIDKADQPTLGSTRTYLYVPEGYKLVKSGLEKELYYVVDNEGNLNPEFEPHIIDIMGQTVDEKSLQSEKLTYQDGENVIHLASPSQTFAAKLALARGKDYLDAIRYVIHNKEAGQKLITKVFKARGKYGTNHLRLGGFNPLAWITGDIVTEGGRRIYRVAEIQSDVYQQTEGKPLVVMEGEFERLNLKDSSVFNRLINLVAGVEEKGFVRVMIKSAINEALRAGADAMRFPISTTVAWIEKFGVWEDVNDNKIVSFYETTVRNMVKKEFGQNSYEVLDEEKRPWIEVDLRKVKEAEILFNEGVGINISSYEPNLGGLLSNFAQLPIKFRGNEYQSAEAAYQANKKELDDDSVLKLMIEIMTAKFQQHPELLKAITERGGLSFLEKSTHNLVKDGRTVKEDRWTGKDGLFMKALREVYKNLTGGQEPKITRETAIQNGKLSTSSLSNNSIHIKHGVTADDVKEYFKGKRPNQSGSHLQKAQVYRELSAEERKLLEGLESQADAESFLIAYEKSHLRNQDHKNYPKDASGKPNMFDRRALDMELRSIRDALSETASKKAEVKPQLKPYTVSEALAEFFSGDVAVPQHLLESMEYIVGKIGGAKVVYGDNATELVTNKGKKFTLAGYRGLVIFEKGEATIYVNLQHPELSDETEIYKTIAHEVSHVFIRRALRQDSIFRKNMKALYTEWKKDFLNDREVQNNPELLQDAERIFREEGRKVGDWEDSYLDEFIAYTMSYTSQIRDWMRVHYPERSKTSYLKKYIILVMDAMRRLFGAEAKASYLNIFEYMLDERLGLPVSEDSVPFTLAVPTQMRRQDLRDRAQDVIDRALALDEEVMDDLRGLESFMDAFKGDYPAIPELQVSPYEYIQSLSWKGFSQMISSSKRLEKRMILMHQLKYQHMSFEEYKATATKYVYNLVKNAKRRKVARLDFASGEPKVYYETQQYKDFNGDPQSVWFPRIIADDYLPDLEAFFGVKLELVYINEIRDEKGVFKPGENMSRRSNKVLKDALLESGIIFPGTWADKSTAIGFRFAIDDMETILKKINELYSDVYKPAIENLLNVKPEIGEDYAREGAEGTHPMSVFRMFLENLRLGGNAQILQLFNPSQPDSYDAIKIFKRPYVIAPRGYFEQDADEVREITERVVENAYGNNWFSSGIVVKGGKIHYRTLMFDSKMEKGKYIFNYRGKDYDIAEILQSTFGTETTDGAVIFGLGGFDVIWRKLNGIAKRGAIKLWGQNLRENPEFNQPWFLKTAFHGFSQKDIVVKWMRQMGIGLLVSSSAVKVNYIKEKIRPLNLNITDPNEYQDAVFDLPIEALNRIQEKDEVKDIAKGLQQTFTTNYFVKQNEALSEADPKGHALLYIKNLIDNLVEDWERKMSDMDSQGLMNYLKQVILNPTNEYHRGLSSVLQNLLFTEADRLYERILNDKSDPKAAEYLWRMRDYREQVFVNNKSVAEKFANFLYHPYFNRFFEDYLHNQLKSLVFYELPSNYAVLAPDLGILASTRYEKAFGFVTQELKKKYKEPARRLALIRSKIRQGEEVTEKRDRTIKAITESIKGKKDTTKGYKRGIEKINKLQARQDLELEALGQFKAEETELAESLSSVTKTGYLGLRDETFASLVDRNAAHFFYPESGRLKPGYGYLTKDITDKFSIKRGDHFISAMVPSDSAQSVSGQRLLAILDGSQSELNKIVLSNEYAGTQNGKDHDLDTVLTIPYSRFFGQTRYEFDELAYIFFKTAQNYNQFLLKIFREVLNDNTLTQADIYSKDKRVEFMHAVAEARRSKKVFNPMYDQHILDYYEKQIGGPVNRRKFTTTKAALKMKTSFMVNGKKVELDFSKPNNRGHVTHLIETNAMVDIPSDDTALKYTHTTRTQFKTDFGTALPESVSERQAKNMMFHINEMDNFLFGFGTKLSTKWNLINREWDRTLQDSAGYVVNQRMVLNYLKTPEGRAYLAYLYTQKAQARSQFELKDEEKKLIKEYIGNMEIGDPEESIPMYLVNKIDLKLIPSVKMSYVDYLKTELKSHQRMLQLPVYADVRQLFRGIAEKYKDYIKAAGQKDAQYERVFQILTTVNPSLNLLKGKIMKTLSQFYSGSTLEHPQAVRGAPAGATFRKNLEVLADKATIRETMKRLFNKPVLRFQRNAAQFEVSGYKLQPTEKGELLINGTPHFSLDKDARLKFLSQLEEKTGLRGALAKIVDIGDNIDLKERYEILEEVIYPEYERLDTFEKNLLLFSLMATPVEEVQDEKGNPLGLVFQKDESLVANSKFGPENERFLELMSVFKGQTAETFLQNYARSFGEEVPTPNFADSIELHVRQAQKEADFEVYAMLGAKDTPMQKNIIDHAMEYKSSDYQPGSRVGRNINLITGQIEGMTTLDVAQAISPFDVKNDRAVNEIEVLYGRLKHISEQVEGMKERFRSHQIKIGEAEAALIQFQAHKERPIPFSLSAKGLLNRLGLFDPGKADRLNKIREEVFDLIEENPYGFTVDADGRVYINSVRFNSAEDALNSIQGLSREDYLKHQMALEYHMIYSVENIAYLSSMIAFIDSTLMDYSNYSFIAKSLISMRRRYESFLNKMVHRQFNYAPHIIHQDVFETEVVNYLKGQEAERIRVDIQRAMAFVAQMQGSPQFIPQGIQDLADKDGDEAWILRTANLRIQRDVRSFREGSYGQFVNVFSMERQLPDDKRFHVRNSPEPHMRHHNQMIRMLENDLIMITYLQFEQKARELNMPEDRINDIRDQVASLSGNKVLHSHKQSPLEIKRGQEISFFYRGRYIQGIVDEVDFQNNFVKLKMDVEAFRRYIERKIRESQNFISRLMAGYPDSPASATQLHMLDRLYQEGRISHTELDSVATILDAAQLYLVALQRIQAGAQTEGTFKISELTVQQQGALGPISIPGVYRYMPRVYSGKVGFYSSLDYMKTLARELENTWDSDQQSFGFKDYVRAHETYKYLKLKLLPDLVSSLRSAQSYIGLSGKGAGLKNILQATAALARDLGIINLTKTYFRSRELRKDIKGRISSRKLQGMMPRITFGRFEDQAAATREITLRFLAENGLLQEDYLMQSVIGSYQELFTEDEMQSVQYSTLDKLFNLRRLFYDSLGYKEYRQTLRELQRQLFLSVSPQEIAQLTLSIQALKRDWESRQRNFGMFKNITETDIQTLANTNLAEARNMTRSEIVRQMPQVISASNVMFMKSLFGTESFKRAEGRIRRFAALCYAWDSIYNQGLTDEKSITLKMKKGIERTQGLYDKLHRRLGDKTTLGQVWLMFGHFNYFAKQLIKRALHQQKAEDRKDLTQEIMKQFARDIFLSSWNVMIPGMRLGHPVTNIMTNSLFLTIAAAMAAMDDDKDSPIINFKDWDTKMFIFDLLSLRYGMTGGLLGNAAYHYAFGVGDAVNFGRIGRGLEIMSSLIFPSGAKNEYWENRRLYHSAMMWILSFDPFFQLYGKSTDKELKEHYRKPLHKRMYDYMLAPVERFKYEL